MIMQDNEKNPALRFKGFTDPWEQRKLDEAFDFTVPNNTLSRAELNQESGSVRNVHYGDVLIKYGSVLDVQNDELPFITGRSKDDFKGALLQNGDIIIADTAEDETTGKVCEIVNIQDKDVVAGLHTMVCRPKNKTAEGYFGYYMNSSSYHHQLLPLMQGIKVLSLSKTNVQKTTVKYPKDKAEQQKIADCLRRIDTLITLHQRKYEKLVNIKKSMLNKMFPPNGASVPEIRFKGFTDPWEQRKLKELYFQLTERNTDLLPYQKTLSVATMSFKTDGNGAADTSLANYKRLRTGDIAFEGHTSKEFRYGRFVLNDVGDGIMSPRFSALRPLHEMPINFWKYYIHYEPIMRKVLVNSTKAGTMMNELVINDFLQGSILVPSMTEQQAIGRFFKQLDTLITLHQRKLEKLQNIKKSCLEKMFV